MTMKVGKDQVSFSWKNYTRPTPANLERIAGAVRDLLAGAAGLTAITQAHYLIPTILSFGIISVGQAVKFFASIKEEEDRRNQDDDSPTPPQE